MASNHVCSLGFLKDTDGKRSNAFPRISAVVDGAQLDFLFDTGATVYLADEAIASFDVQEPRYRGTSFITNTVFERWRAKHPDWPVIEHADLYMDEAMIQVPSIHIAGYEVGPVWFTRRPDHNFHHYMSQWMDKRVEGALGGRYFVISPSRWIIRMQWPIFIDKLFWPD